MSDHIVADLLSVREPGLRNRSLIFEVRAELKAHLCCKGTHHQSHAHMRSRILCRNKLKLNSAGSSGDTAPTMHYGPVVRPERHLATRVHIFRFETSATMRTRQILTCPDTAVTRRAAFLIQTYHLSRSASLLDKPSWEHTRAAR